MNNDLSRERFERNKWNLIMFVISFAMSNLISGVIYDAYINYLQEVARDVSTHFWSYYGYATFISALMVLLVNKIGYKWTLLFCPVTAVFSLISLLYLEIEGLYEIMTILVLVGLQLHYAMLAPFIATYTTETNRDKWYSRAYWIGYSGWTIMTFLGGFLTVLFFALRGNLDFNQARLLTENVFSMEGMTKVAYLQGNRDVLFITMILSIISVFPILFMKQENQDYRYEKTNKVRFSLVNFISNLKALLNKYSIVFIAYLSLIYFGMGLFTPYFTVFLNRNLFIDRSTASLLVSISYAALVLFVIVSPKCVKRFGRIKTMTGTVYLSIPFMIVIANGDKFGSFMIPAVGIGLFLRSGLANLGAPVESAIGMEIVPKELRPSMSSLTNIVIGFMSVLSGKFTGSYLFKSQAGYKWGYYLASILYLIASILLNIVFRNYEKEVGDKIE